MLLCLDWSLARGSRVRAVNDRVQSHLIVLTNRFRTFSLLLAAGGLGVWVT